MKIPTLVAHRGYMECYPENSLIGLKAALQAGACVVEFDLQRMSDGEFVLLHDTNLKRTSGQDREIFDLTSDQLRHFSVHEPQRFGDRFSPTPIPCLREVLQLLKNCPQAKALVEIKQESMARWHFKTVIDQLLEILGPYRNQCSLISYSHEALSYAQQEHHFPTGWVLQHYNKDHQKKAEGLQPQLLICNVRKIPNGQPLWPGHWQWIVYDIIDPGLALSWAEKGAELIETADIGGMLNHPQLAEKACDRGL